jgi:hypothetical protein
MGELIWFLAGALVGYLGNLASTASYPSVLRFVRRTYRKFFKHPPTTPSKPERLSIGGLFIDWIVLARAQYLPDRIKCYYDDRPVPLVPKFARMLKEYTKECKERLKRGDSGVPYNSTIYKLKEFDVGYREIIEGAEVPVLRLTFGPTDYYTQIITDLNVGNSVHERYAAATDITIHPVPEFASILGIGFNVITKDDYLIVSERSTKSYISSGKLHNSIGENLLRPTDAGSNGAPDLYRCALRGAQEELGVVLDIKDMIFTAFGVHPEFCQYSLLGTAYVKETKDEVIALRALAIPKDKWENRQLLFVRFTPDDVARFLISTLDRWHPWGLATVVLSLFTEYDKEVVDKAFWRARTKIEGTKKP